MNVIKLDAIDSTNDFLKGISQKNDLENFTVVTTKTQTKGKGQMGTTWNSESFKNLTISILIKNSVSHIDQIFTLNTTIAISLIQALKSLHISSLQVKWPNDIMAENKKIAGILIENTVKENGRIDSIVGIGMNVNQTNFENLPKATSLKNITKRDFDLDKLLEKIVSQIEKNVQSLEINTTNIFWDEYHNYLFKKGRPTLFENNLQEKFMGIIEEVDQNGKIKIRVEDDSFKVFGIKEITMIY